MLLRFAIRELRAYPRYTLLFVLNIIVGLIGLATLESFNDALAREIKRTSRLTAGGDLVVASRLKIPDSVANSLAELLPNEEIERGDVEELLTMASTKNSTRLVQVRAQTPNLPFYGTLELNPKLSTSELETSFSTWISPELKTQLQLEIGDSLKIGDVTLRISAVVEKDAVPQLGRGALAPRIYISRKSLQASGLVQKGSTISYEQIYKLPESANAEEIARSLDAEIKDSSVNIRGHTQVSEASARVMSLIADYMGLVALIALLLSNVGAIYLIRAHLADRLRDMSVLKMLGLQNCRIVLLYALETFLLTAAGVVMASIICVGALPAMSRLTQEFLPFALDVTPSLSSLFLIALVGIANVLFCVFPLLFRLRSVTPGELFQESFAARINIRREQILAWLPALVFFCILAIWQANSFKVAGIFVLSLTMTFVAIYLIGYLILKMGEYIIDHRRFEIRFAVREIVRRPFESLTKFVTFAMGVLLTALVFTIEDSLKNEFLLDDETAKPSLFLFDIQEEQLRDIQSLTQKIGVRFAQVSPLVRARLVAINDSEDYVMEGDASLQTREQQQSARSRNRTFNLTERQQFSSSEILVRGRPFRDTFDPSSGNPPEISVEERFAERIGVDLGDRLRFDVLGIPLTGEVVSIRQVKWTSYQPNFFIQFQEGVLTDTPKSYIASTAFLPSDLKIRFQQESVRLFPNVSMVDVSQAVATLVETTSNMALAIQIMAVLILVASLLVLVSIQKYHVQRTSQQRSLLSLLGVITSRIHRIEITELWLLSLPALFLGWLINYLVAWPLTHIFFARTPDFSVNSLLVFLLLVPLIIRSLWPAR